MIALAAACAFFGAIHLGLSGTRLRDWAVAVMGEQTYRAAFSIGSVIGIVAMAMTYSAAMRAGPDQLFFPGPGITHLGIPVMLVVFLLGVTGLLTKNPTAAGFEDSVDAPDTVQGLLRITRHPFLWSVSIFSLFHLLANGDAASALFFGTLFVVAFAGTFSIDAKRARVMGARWSGFAAKTSNVPFAAILGGRQRLSLAEIGIVKPLVALGAFACVLFVHAWLFGVSPFPGGWVPF